MKFITNVDISLFDQFVRNSPYNHYMKTSIWADYQKQHGFKPYFVGVEDNGKLIATALILENKIPIFGKYQYIPWGPCLDYSNQELLNFLLTNLKKFAQEHRVMFMRLDTNIQRVSRDILGKQIAGINNEYLTEMINQAGFIHKGYGYGYDGSWANRYTLIIDIKPELEIILQNFNKPRQQALKRHNLIGVTTRTGTKQDLTHLVRFEKELSAKMHFKPHSIEFFSNLIKQLKPYSHFYVTEIDINQAINFITEELSSNKYNKDPEAKASKAKELNLFKQLQLEYGDIIPLAAGIFMYYGNKSWDLYAYSAKDFPMFKVTDNLHYHAIREMKSLGVKYYDMVGFSGKTNREDEYYGLYDYKSSFGSEFIEYLGEFNYLNKPRKYQLYRKYLRYYYKVKRKVNRFLYKKK